MSKNLQGEYFNLNKFSLISLAQIINLSIANADIQSQKTVCVLDMTKLGPSFIYRNCLISLV